MKLFNTITIITLFLAFTTTVSAVELETATPVKANSLKIQAQNEVLASLNTLKLTLVEMQKPAILAKQKTMDKKAQQVKVSIAE
jgi:hypothetical protein